MITIYSKPSCSACVQAKQLCDAKGIEYEYKVLGKDYDLEQMFEVVPMSVRSFPAITKDGEYLGSLHELKALLSN